MQASVLINLKQQTLFLLTQVSINFDVLALEEETLVEIGDEISHLCHDLLIGAGIGRFVCELGRQKELAGTFVLLFDVGALG